MAQLRILAVLLVLLGSTSYANATIIDFEGIKTTENSEATAGVYREIMTERNYGVLQTKVLEGFYADDDSTGIASGTPDNGSDYLITRHIRIYERNGGPFSLQSADFGERMLNYDDDPVKMIARYEDGSSMTRYFEFDHEAGFETFFFDQSWQNLSEVLFLNDTPLGFMTLDNIQVSSSTTTVPEPPTVFLLTLGLLALRSKQRAH